MSTIVTRAGKGSALTHTEVDANFTNLNTDKLQSGNTAASLTITNLSGTTVTYTNATISSATISGGTINSTTVGATTPAAGTFTSLSDSGNLTFTGTGNRITGDFSNTTLANRVMFQTSTANSATVVSAIPSGTSVSAQIQLFNNSDPTNAGRLQFAVGSTEAQIFSSISGTGTYLPMTFYTGGSERMRIDTSGNVGIGVTPNGSYKLQVNGQINGTSASITGANSGAIYVQDSNTAFNPQIQFIGTNRTFQLGTGNSASGFNNQFFIYDGTAAATRMLIDSSGNVGIGSTSITRAYANYNQLNLNGTSGATIQMQAGGTSYANFVADSNALYVQGQTAIAFGVGGSGTGTERARIDSSGNLTVGATSMPEAAKIGISSSSASAVPLVIQQTAAGSTTQNSVVFYRNTTSTGTIQVTGTTTAYNTSSDYRLKENVQPMTGALAKVAALKPVTYTWKLDGSLGEGFIAHELAEVVPQAVGGEKDAVNEDGSIKPQGIDTSFLVATLTAAIQEQQQMIEILQAEVAALKGA